jgi:hypothetical protein
MPGNRRKLLIYFVRFLKYARAAKAWRCSGDGFASFSSRLLPQGSGEAKLATANPSIGDAITLSLCGNDAGGRSA